MLLSLAAGAAGTMLDPERWKALPGGVLAGVARIGAEAFNARYEVPQTYVVPDPKEAKSLTLVDREAQAARASESDVEQVAAEAGLGAWFTPQHSHGARRRTGRSVISIHSPETGQRITDHAAEPAYVRKVAA